jgi:LPS-assembly protein
MKKEPLSGTSNQCATAPACESSGLNDLYLGGDHMERQDGHYLIDKARFTTCDCRGGRPTWEIRASSADVLPNERAWMTWPIFYAKGLPVFILPAAYLPLSDRRTGLLFPQVNFSGRDGVVLSESLFVTLGRSADTTLSYDWFQDRGSRERVEFRVRPSETSDLVMRLGFLQDHKSSLATIIPSIPPVFFPTGGPPNKLRFSGDLNAFADFSPQTALRTSLHLYSDSSLVSDFRSDMAGRAVDDAPSQIAFWQRGAQTLFALDGTYYQDLRFGGEKMFSDKTVYDMKPSDTIHRLGAVTWALAPVSLTNFPLRLSLELETANFSSLGVSWRDWGMDGMPASQLSLPPVTNLSTYETFDGEGNSRLGTGELRRAVRMMVKPTIDIPVRLGSFLEIEGQLFHRQFLYLPHGPLAPDPFTRGLSYASLRASSELTRSFGDQNQFGHLISPFVQVAGAWPGLSSSVSPQFFDWQDRLTQHAVQLIGGFETSLYRNGWLGWSKLINVSLWQGYDLERGRPAQMTGLIKVDQAPVSFDLVLGGDWEKHSLAEVDANLGLQLPGGHSVGISYLYLPSFKDTNSGTLLPLAERTQQEDGLPLGLAALPERAFGDSLHLIDLNGKLQIFESLSLNANANIDLFLKEVIWYGGGIAYNSTCRCFGLALTIRMLRGLKTPDVFLWLDLGVLGAGGTGSNTMF